MKRTYTIDADIVDAWRNPVGPVGAHMHDTLARLVNAIDNTESSDRLPPMTHELYAALREWYTAPSDEALAVTLRKVAGRVCFPFEPVPGVHYDSGVHMPTEALCGPYVHVWQGANNGAWVSKRPAMVDRVSTWKLMDKGPERT